MNISGFRLAILKIFLICLPACLSCFAENAVLTSDFDQMVSIRVPESARSSWKRNGRHIDVAGIEKMLQDRNWTVDWESCPDKCRFYVHDSRWGISAEGLTVYSKTISRPTCSRYLLKLEAAAPADADTASSGISAGVFHYGLIHPGGSLPKEIRVKRGECVSCDIPLTIGPGLPSFRVMLKISGNVILKKMALLPSPSELARDGITVVEGTLKEVSELPSPQKSDYPDCRFTALLEGNSIIDGVPCPQKVQLVIDGFRNYKLLKTKKLKPGNKIRCGMLPFEKLPDKDKSVQQADDLNLFELQSFYALEIEKIHVFSEVSPTPFADAMEYVSVFERKINPPLSAEMKKMQQEAIGQALRKINSRLAPYTDERIARLNADFAKAWETEKAKDPPGFNRIALPGNRKYVWRNVDNSFWALPENHVFIPRDDPIAKDKLESLLALQEFLNANGCQFMIGIIPDFYAIAARVMNKQFREVPDFGSARLARELLNNGLETVYASDRLLNNYNRYQFAFFYPDNYHPSDTAQDILTDLFSELLMRYRFRPTLAKKRFSTDLFINAYKDKYCFPQNCDIGSNQAGTPVFCRRVLYDGETISSAPQSPLLVLGNSFIQTPMKNPYSFPTLLAMKTHMDISWFGVASSGPFTTIMNSLFANPEKLLKGKKVVILVLGEAHFHKAIRPNNIKTMDRDMRLLSGKSLQKTITVRGNVPEIPAHFRHLTNVRCFSVPESRALPITDMPLPQDHKDVVLVIPVCAAAPCPAEFKINDTAFKMPECGGQYLWNRVIVPVPKAGERLKIELVGAPGATVAMGDIQVFQ